MKRQAKSHLTFAELAAQAMKARALIAAFLVFFGMGVVPEAAWAQQSPEVSFSLTVSTDAGSSQQLDLGLDSTATAGIDTAFGETEQPPIPPSGVFDARFIDDDISLSGLGEGVLVDIREGSSDFVGGKQHEIRVQPDEEATEVTIAWTLPAGVTGQLEDVATGGGQVSEPMVGDSSYTLTDLSIARFSVALSYDEPNVGPEASVDSFETTEGETLVVGSSNGVLSNDTDADGDSLQASVVSGVSNGTLLFDADGSFSYSPDPGFNGQDSFTYEVDDGRGGTDQATVAIDVRPSSAPVVSFPITVTADTSSEELTLGLDPDATDGIDPDLGETEQPPLPPSEIFDARLIDDDISAGDFGEGLLVDIRPGGSRFIGTKTHEIQYQPGSSADSVTISWELPRRVTGTLEDVATGGSQVSVSMEGTDSFTITDLSITKLTVTLDYGEPTVALSDGRDGLSYNTPSPEPGTDNNPVGRFVLSARKGGIQLSDLTVENDGSALTGVASAELWESTDPTFEAGNDDLVATDSSATPASFQGLNVSVSDSTYLFVVVDLTEDGGGDYDPVIRSEADLGLSGGVLAEVNGAADSTFVDAYLSTSATALPVEIASFDAVVSDDEAVLRWTTTSETNNAEFRVQRRSEERAASGRASWKTIGSVEGAGTTQERQKYRFRDAELSYEADRLSYRLKQVDTDGSTYFSEPVTVERTTREVELIGAHPNPATQRATVRYALPERQGAGSSSREVTVRLYDVLGRQVRTIASHHEAGRHEQTIDVSDLPSGMYLLQLRANGETRTRKLTVVR